MHDPPDGRELTSDQRYQSIRRTPNAVFILYQFPATVTISTRAILSPFSDHESHDILRNVLRYRHENCKRFGTCHVYNQRAEEEDRGG